MRRLSSLAAAVLIAACSQGPGAAGPTIGPGTASPAIEASPTSGGSESPAIEASPTSGESDAPSASPRTGATSNAWLAVVLADALNVRSAPTTGATKLDAIGKGSRVLVLDSAVQADGYRWYPVGWSGAADAASAGWVGSGATSDTWLSADEVSCPAPTIAAILELTPVWRLGCYGSKSLTFTAYQAAEPDSGIGGGCRNGDLPAWLACVQFNWVNQTGGATVEHLNLYFDPALGVQPTGLAPVGTTGPAYEVRGHFNDPASLTCAADQAPGSLAYRGDWLECATRFVVEGLRVVGPAKS